MQMSWSKCVELYGNLQNDESGTIGRIQNIDKVDFNDFIRSFKSMDENKVNDKVQAVHRVLKISRHLKRVHLVNHTGCSDLDEVHLKLFLKVFADVKLTELDISENNFSSPEGWLCIGRLIKQSVLKKLTAGWCDLKAEDLEKLLEGMDGSKLTKLDISWNRNISSEGWLCIGRLIKQSVLQKLKAEHCYLEAEGVEKLLEGMDGSKLTELDISDNCNISSEGWLCIGRLIKQSVLQKLTAPYCDPEEEDLEKLLEGMDGSKLTELDISGNCDISPEGWLCIGRLIKQSVLQKLRAQCCDPEEEDLEKLLEGMDGSKLTELDISWNRRISSEGWLCIGRLIKQSVLQKLRAWECNLEAEGVEKLLEGMDGSKLDRLDLGCDELFSEEVKDCLPVLLELLPLINEELDLSSFMITQDERVELQKKLNQDCLTSLTISIKVAVHEDDCEGERDSDCDCDCDIVEERLKASPLGLPSIFPDLPRVQNAEAEQEGGSILATWDPLPNYNNIYYYIVVECEGRAVGEPVTTSDTEYRVRSIQSERKYLVFVWGCTGETISECASWCELETEDIPTTDTENSEPSMEAADTEIDSRKRSLQALNADATGEKCKPKKAKLLSYTESASSDHEIDSTSSGQGEHQNPRTSSVSTSVADPNITMASLTETNASNQAVITQRNSSSEASWQNNHIAENPLYLRDANYSNHSALNHVTGHAEGDSLRGRTESGYPNDLGQNRVDTYDEGGSSLHPTRNELWEANRMSMHSNVGDYSHPSYQYGEASSSNVMSDPSANAMATLSAPSSTLQDYVERFVAPSSTVPTTVYTPLRNVNSSTDDMDVLPQAMRDAGISSTSVPDVTSTIMDHPSHVSSDPTLMERKVVDLENRMNQEIAILHREIGNKATKIVNLQQEITSLKQDKAAQATEIQENMANHQQEIAAQATKITSLQEKLASLEKCVEGLKTTGEASDPDQIKDFDLPMDTFDHVKENEKLLEDREITKRLVSFLATIGGSHKRDVIWRIMKQLFTNELAMKYSWEGRKGKSAFCKLKMADVIKESAKKNKVSEAKTEKFVMNWLKSAGDRDGGRERRQERKQKKESKNAGAQSSCST